MPNKTDNPDAWDDDYILTHILHLKSCDTLLVLKWKSAVHVYNGSIINLTPNHDSCLLENTREPTPVLVLAVSPAADLSTLKMRFSGKKGLIFKI